MNTDTEIRNQLIRRIRRIPLNRLKELNALVDMIEETTTKKDKNLSFAGAWTDIDSETLNNLSENLVENRQRNKRRNDKGTD